MKCLKWLLTLVFTTFLIFPAVIFSGAIKASIVPAPYSDATEMIGKKVWKNECAGTTTGLISWNDGENFLSLGIGHFIWYHSGGIYPFEESFPKLIVYMRERCVNIPSWLNQPTIPKCPWRSKEEFSLAVKNNDQRLQELQQFLEQSISNQAQYLVYRLQTTLPQILMLIPVNEQRIVQQKIMQLMKTPLGLYSLVDYINFKGDGIRAYTELTLESFPGWGLLQVLRIMQYAPTTLTVNQAFAWAARNILIRRVATASNERKRQEEKWLPGWLNRINTYQK